jgi:hypothetical protein
MIVRPVSIKPDYQALIQRLHRPPVGAAASDFRIGKATINQQPALDADVLISGPAAMGGGQRPL